MEDFYYYESFFAAFSIFNLVIIFISCYELKKPKIIVNFWNCLDFLILLDFIYCFYLNFKEKYIYFGPLKILKLMKIIPFKTFKSIIGAFSKSFTKLLEIFFVFLIFLSCYSILGVELFSGVLLNRCFNQKLGLIFTEEFCGNKNCNIPYICIKTINNPDLGLTNFDNIFFAFLQNIRIITFDNWTDLMSKTQITITSFSFIYYIFLIFIGNFFLLNLILAILKFSFSHTIHLKSNIDELSKNENNIEKSSQNVVYKGSKIKLFIFAILKHLKKKFQIYIRNEKIHNKKKVISIIKKKKKKKC